ncbi:MAG: hypothetical protein GY950_14685, partial [bacterium]|nr:hypothetical protein [bacterium]
MAIETAYDIDVCNTLTKKFYAQKLHRPPRVGLYDPGAKLTYDIMFVEPLEREQEARVHLEIQKFVGGGFAGQVYQVKVLDIERKEKTSRTSVGGPGHRLPLEKGGLYALKILIPPSGFSRFFRNLMYRIGFQGPFQLQVNPTAVRAGAIWQKLIRRGAKIQLGDEKAVNDIHGTCTDATLGSCGEISEWVEGRTWRLEVDQR